MSESRILYTPRQHKRKQKKFSKKKLYIVRAFVGFVAFLAVCISMVRLSYFQLQKITVNGNGTEQDAHELETAIQNALSGNYALVIPKRFIFGVSAQYLAERLAAVLPRFETITVARQFPHAISVSYTKRTFFALLCNGAAQSDTHSCGYIDHTGFVYEDAPEASGSLIVKITSDLSEVKVGTRAIDESTTRQMALFGGGLQRIAGLRLTAYGLDSKAPDEFRMRVAEGFTLIVQKDGNPETVLHILRTVLDQEIKDKKPQIDYIDLRLGNKVFYKFKKT
ncbi:MAG: hypothetical protein HY007_04415 [Candidatus Sungbacteria bacterium]|nr:hypothetical protein [Candidatus Sungbacteria bacterium]